jgi:hypothetical protein
MGDGHAIADHYSAVGFYCTGGDIAQTGIGVLDVWLKARESADAPNDKKVTLYTKSARDRHRCLRRALVAATLESHQRRRRGGEGAAGGVAVITTSMGYMSTA